MKILMVSIFSNHFFNWVAQLKESSYELYWMDIYDSNIHVKKIDFVNQIYGWRNKFDYPGRYYVKKELPFVYKAINLVNQRKFKEEFKRKFNEIKPDVVHSFVMYAGAVPILDLMTFNTQTKWVFSAWGNDLYYYQNKESFRNDMKEVLPHLDYMFADCKRDYFIARNLGFTGNYLGTYPTGGGYDFNITDQFIQDFDDKKTILIKGYEHKFGRCINVLKAISPLKNLLGNYKIAVFGANDLVFKHVDESELKDWENLKVHANLEREEVLKLMGESLIYIGNSISDGMPNTLLEAIIMEVFPIQSNPGGATAEIIKDGKNGFLINNAENQEEIGSMIKKALQNPDFIKKAIDYNTIKVKPQLERGKVKREVLEKYSLIRNELTN